MHVVHPRTGDENHAEAHNAPATKTDAEDAGIDELMHHTDAMLRDDNAQLDQVFLYDNATMSSLRCPISKC